MINFNISTGYFPQIYTDIQPFLCLLSLYINGKSEINENVWNNRISYIHEFNKFGYNIQITNNKIIIDNTKFKMINNILKEFICTDLRGGMALYLLLKLKNIDISNINLINKIYIDRGYYNYDYNINLIMKTKNIYHNYETSLLSNIKIGGISKYYAEIYNIEQIKNILLLCKKLNIRYKIIGDGTNIYFDEYFDGIIIRNKLSNIYIRKNKNNYIINCTSGIKLQKLVDLALDNNIDITSLTGIPGTVGGAIYNNSGAYGLEIKDIIYDCIIIDEFNKIRKLNNNDMKLSYRDSIFKHKNYIILLCKFKISNNNNKDNLEKKYKEILDIRNSKFKLTNNLGSVFKNIILNNKKIYAWKILDDLGYRGKIIDEIKFSDNNPNIMVNISNNNICVTKFKNILNNIIQTTKNIYNINLETEIEFIT